MRLMNILLAMVCCAQLQFSGSFASIACAEELDVAALTAADDARVAATIAADRPQLEKILSNELTYAHSNALVDSKQSLIETLVSGKSKYLELTYEKREFREAAPGVALMTGRNRIRVQNATGEVNAALSFLAVWRLESGQWRFLAWQSCRVPTEAPAASK